MLNWDDPRLARLERSGRAAWIWDPRGRRIMWATDEAARLWGLDDSFLLIDRPFGGTDPSAADLDLAASALSHTEGIETEVRLVHSGRTRVLPVMARRFARTEAGDLVLFTPLQRADGGAPAEAHPIAPLFNTFPLGLALFTPTGALLYSNPVFERMIARGTRATLADVLGSEAGAQRFIRALLAAGSVRVTPSLQIEGRELTLQIDAALAEDPRSKRSAFLIEIHDVTARRAREHALAERTVLLKDLLGEAIEGWAVLDRRERVRSFGGRLLEDAPGADNTIGMAWRDAAGTFALYGAEADQPAELAKHERTIDLMVAHEAASLESTPAYSEDGDFIGYHVFLRTRRAAQATAAPQAAREPEAPLDLGLMPILAHDNFEITYANDSAARLFGFGGASDIIGRPFLDFFPEDERRASLHYDELARDATTSSTARLQGRTVGGETRYLDATFRKGRIAGRDATIAGFADVTALIEAEDGGAEDRDERAPLFEAAPHPLLLIDRHGRIARVNAAAARLLGLSEGELLERPFEDLIEKADRTAFEVRRSAARVSDSEGSAIEVRLRTRAGASGSVMLRLSALASPDGAVLIGLTDLEPQKAREEELKRAVDAADQSNRQKTSLLSSVSHEMRTPLNAIIGFSEFMREGRLGPIGNEKYAGYIADILMSGQHLLSLVNDLLDMSKIEAGALELAFAPLDVTMIAEQCLRILSPQAEKKGVILAGSLPRNLPKVMADARSLRQIILNILSNAVKFTPGTGRVIARASYDPERGVVLEIEDTGVGMTEEELSVALQPYRQVHGRAANDEMGTGLGLPLAKALTEANHASFRITSERDKGTRVEIVFPTSQVAAESAGGA